MKKKAKNNIDKMQFQISETGEADNAYCTECGRDLIRVPRPAHKLMINFHFDSSFPLGHKYNTKTGKRQFGIVVKCPKARWWNNHYCHIDENSLHDGDLLELMKM